MKNSEGWTCLLFWRTPSYHWRGFLCWYMQCTWNQNKNLPWMPITCSPNLNSLRSLTSHNPPFCPTSTCFYIIFPPIRMASLRLLTQPLYPPLITTTYLFLPACLCQLFSTYVEYLQSTKEAINKYRWRYCTLYLITSRSGLARLKFQRLLYPPS